MCIQDAMLLSYVCVCPLILYRYCVFLQVNDKTEFVKVDRLFISRPDKRLDGEFHVNVCFNINE